MSTQKPIWRVGIHRCRELSAASVRDVVRIRSCIPSCIRPARIARRSFEVLHLPFPDQNMRFGLQFRSSLWLQEIIECKCMIACNELEERCRGLSVSSGALDFSLCDRRPWIQFLYHPQTFLSLDRYCTSIRLLVRSLLVHCSLVASIRSRPTAQVPAVNQHLAVVE